MKEGILLDEEGFFLTLYDATGKKLETQYVSYIANINNPLIPGEIMDGLDVNEQDLVTINGTAYIDNMEYHLNRYFDWDVSYAPKSVFTLNRVHNPEGYTTYANLKLNKTGPIYHYYRRDHLGNNREVWQAEHLFNNKPKLASTIQRTQYYPSGLPWKSSTADGAALQPYKYGGKEFMETHGLDEYYSYTRNVYPAILRTTTLDPHAESYYSVSPYAWCGNNPVNRVDLDGRDWYSYEKEEEERTRTLYKYVEGMMSKKEMEEGGYTHLGKTYTNENDYYSLFGEKKDLKSDEGQIYQKIDEAIINYNEWNKEMKNPNLWEDPIHTGTDFSSIHPYVPEKIVDVQRNRYEYNYQGSRTFLFVYGENMKAYFKNFGDGAYKNWGGWNNSIKGYQIYLNNRNGMNVVVLSFPSQQSYDNFHVKYEKLFK